METRPIFVGQRIPDPPMLEPEKPKPANRPKGRKMGDSSRFKVRRKK